MKIKSAISKVLFAGLLLPILLNCRIELITAPTVTVAIATNITALTATSGGEVTADGGATVTARGVCWSINQNPTTADNKTSNGSGTSSFTSSLTGLTPGTTYNLRAYAINLVGTGYSSQTTTFTTLALAPILTTTDLSAITATTVTSGGNITNDGGSSVTTRGVCWSKSKDPTTADDKTSDGTGSGSFTSAITGLTPGTTYYFRAYATNSVGTAYGNQVTTITTATLSILTTTMVSAITSTTAESGGNITSDGGAQIMARGVCWSTYSNPTIANSTTSDGFGTGSFMSSITGLTPGATYYVKAYATNNIGTSYGNEFTITATAISPVLTTGNISNITATTAVSSGNITTDGGSPVTVRGVCWSISSNPTILNSKTTDGAGTGSFTSSITGLTPGVTYYVRAYATNNIGTSYGNEFTITTTAILPVLSTSNISTITSTTAISGGNITTDGGSTVTARGVCWSASSNPTILNSKTTDGAGTGSFTSAITGLTPGTTYYIRAYATNSIGTAYGAQVTAAATAILPTLTTTAVSAVTATTATSGGNITSDGGASVTIHGVCWGTSQNPTIANNKTTDGAGTGSFTSNVTGLTAGTTYYVRAYAINSQGTAYGSQETFTTSLTLSLATITTTAASVITFTGATLGGNVTSDGNATVTERGVVYATTQTPTTANTKVSIGTGTGSFTSAVTGLTPSTTYYVRSYAINSVGTSYGSQVSFTTSVQTQLPTLTTTAASAISTTSATSGGSISSDGGATVTARGVCWSTTSNPIIANNKTTDGTGTGSYTSSLTGLTASTTYYVRAYATNSVGTSYGGQVSFTTSAQIQLPTLTTTAASAISTTSATSGGSISSDGGATVTARGVCWSTSQTPTTANSKTTDGTGTGSFTSSLTGLTASTTYYVRSYATNSIGTAYGNQIILVTSVKAQIHPITIHTNQRVASLQMTVSEYNSWVTNDEFGSSVVIREALVQDIYQKFDDKFDFIFLILNEASKPSNLTYYGMFIQTSNAITGVGLQIFDSDNLYCSAGKLKGVMALTAKDFLMNGPSLHELAHNWANFVIPTKDWNGSLEYDAIPHWGFTGGNTAGQLGGFQQNTLQTSIGGNPNKYSVGSFGGYANGGNSVPYNDLELYLMGMIPLTGVANFDVFKGLSQAALVGSNVEFTASTRVSYDQAKILADAGTPRSPSSSTSQKNFRLLVVVLTPVPLTETEWTNIDAQSEWFGRPSSGGLGYIYNFWEATRGLGTIESGNLLNAVKTQ